VSKLDALLQTVAEEQDELRAESGVAERVAQRIQHSAPRARRRIPAYIALAAALGLALSFLALRGLKSAPQLAISVGGRAPLVGAWLGAPDASALPLEFSDGSRFELAARSKARVVEMERASARVELASGSMHVHVIPGGSGNWRIDAGPFGVHVTGTRFVVSYVPEDDVLEVAMEEGQVELTGCVFGAGRKLSAPQRVRASCRTRELEVGYRDAQLRPSPAQAAPLPARREATSPPEATTAAIESGGTPKGAASGAAKGSGTSWVALARAGKYQDAYAAAEHEGFELECQRAGAEDLTLLADVARHARAPRQAKQALLVLRRRFAGGGEASTAAFALGRLEFDEFRAYSAAAEWFRTYLSERPGGPMAREALGRLIEAYQRAGDLASAESTARRYLRDYPSGPHAELASRLVQAP